MKEQICIGFRKGHWTVEAPAEPDERHRRPLLRERWTCRCRCGHSQVHSASSLLYDMSDRSACRSCAMKDAARRRGKAKETT